MIDAGDNNWKIVQTKTFTKWMNNILKKSDYEPVNDLFEDMSTGIPLIHLLKALNIGDVEYNKNPVLRIAKMENVSFGINLIKSRGVHLVNIGPEDIVDRNSKLILGLIWTIISSVNTSQDLSSEIMSLKEELLQWVQKVTHPYENLSVKNFTTSWKNGLAFNAIIHRFRPELIDYEKLDIEDGIKNCNNAFSIAENNFGIPRLLDAEDVNESIIPDEKCIITYVSLFYQYFKSEEKEMEKKAFLSMFLKGYTLSVTGEESYEARAKESREILEELEKNVEETNENIKKAIEGVKSCKKMRNELRKRYVELGLLLNNIQDNQTLFNLKLYNPPEKLKIENFNYNDISISIDELLEILKPERDNEELETIKKECVAALIESNKQIQKKKLTELKNSLKTVKLANNENKAFVEFFISCLERKEESLSKFSEFEKYNLWLSESTKKLFAITDKNNMGTISLEECKKIISALKLNINDIPKLNKDRLTLDELLGIVNSCNSLVIQSSKVERLFKEFGKNGAVKILDILPNIDIKHLPVNENGELEFSDIKNSFNN